MFGINKLGRILTIMATLALLSLSACDDDTNSTTAPNDDDPVIDGVIVLDFDGRRISFTDASGLKDTPSGIITISGILNSSSEAVTVNLPDSPGIYTMTAGEVIGFTVVTEGELFVSDDDLASIELTTVTATQVTGTFSGQVSNFLQEGHAVTDGAFQVDYVTMP